MSEKTTSEFMLEIASHYLINGCDDCPFYDITKTCDSVPINCTWMRLKGYFEAEEAKEESELAEPERKKGKWIYDTERVAGDGWTYSQYHCSECGFQELGGLANFCPHCGADMRGEHGKA